MLSSTVALQILFKCIIARPVSLLNTRSPQIYVMVLLSYEWSYALRHSLWVTIRPNSAG